MGDVLSQSEIDALLNALTSGDIDVNEVQDQEALEKSIKKHDFARPSKFGKEQLRTLEIIYDNYSRIVTSFMSGYLRTSVAIEVVGAEQVSYGEFNNSLSNPVVLGVIDFEPLKGSIVLDLSPGLGYAIIDRILGGSGRPFKISRDFSEIEKVLLDRVIHQLTGFLIEPFENVLELNPTVEKIETNPQFAQIISPSEMVALVTLKVSVGEVEGLINFCIPHLVVEPIMHKLNTKFWFSTQEEEDNAEYKHLLEKKLEFAKIPVKVVLGKTKIMVNDFIDLQVGDVISLNTFIQNDIDVYVGQLHKFVGKPGMSKGKRAVQITSIVRKEE